jgi:hypothetical protein
MSYRMSEHDYVSLATCMSVELLLQSWISLGVLGIHGTKLLRIVEVEPEHIALHCTVHPLVTVYSILYY